MALNTCWTSEYGLCDRSLVHMNRRTQTSVANTATSDLTQGSLEDLLVSVGWSVAGGNTHREHRINGQVILMNE